MSYLYLVLIKLIKNIIRHSPATLEGLLIKFKVDEYMEQLDNNKPPKVGSQGEKYRDLQLIIQLPKQVKLS